MAKTVKKNSILGKLSEEDFKKYTQVTADTLKQYMTIGRKYYVIDNGEIVSFGDVNPRLKKGWYEIVNGMVCQKWRVWISEDSEYQSVLNDVALFRNLAKNGRLYIKDGDDKVEYKHEELKQFKK